MSQLMGYWIDYTMWWNSQPDWIAWLRLPVTLLLALPLYLATLHLMPHLLRAATFLYRTHQKAHHKWYRAKVDWKRARRDTPSYRKLAPTWRYRLRYHWTKARTIPLPEVKLDKRIALRTRREWNRMRDTVAPVVLAEKGWYCSWCDEPLDEDNWSIDHIHPISRGGTNELWNLQPMCRACNAMKGDRTDIWGKFWDKVAV